MAAGTIGGEDPREKIREAESKKNKVYTRKDQNKPRNPIRQTLASTTNTDDNTSSQPHQAIAMVESDDSSSLNLVEPGAQNVNNGNGRSGYVKYDNLVKINLNSITKSEARGIKSKLASELDQVRSLVKKLEAKEVQFSSGYARSQFSANEIVDRPGSLVRVNSEVGSVGVPNSQPFCGHSVSVADNMTIHGNHGVDVVGSGSEFVDKERRTPKANQYKNSDFLLGKEKSMPTDGNKKLKPNVGRHNGGGIGGSGPDRFPNQLFKKCSNLLGRLMKHKFGWVFNAPVDVEGLGLRDYYSIIKHPMDLGTVKTRFNNHWYKSPRDFAEDVRLTFSNAMLYNPKGQDVHFMAETLSKTFEESWAPIEAEYNLNRQCEMGHDMVLPTPNPRKFPAPSSAPAPTTPAPPPPPPLETRSLERSESMTMPVVSKSRSMNLAPTGRTPAPKKPKAKDPDKRDMTYEEKQRLSISLRNLPSDKIDSIVQIIKKRNPALFQQEDEIEVDIDCVDPETLWELDRFVTNYKKSLSKIKRKAELALQASAEADNNVQQANPRPPAAEAPKAAEAVERIVSSSSPVHGEKQGNITSGSSSSSSSSSDSGSSSTDSDGDSSSG